MVKSVLIEYVDCAGCTKEITVAEAFDNVRRCWPRKFWVQFECSECSEENIIELRKKLVIQGYLDEAPAPCFIPKREVPFNDLSVKKHGEKLVVKALNVR